MDHNATIVVIEDEPDIRSLIVDQLTRSGFRVRTAADGDEGLALALRVDASAIILDLMLPGLPGTEVCRRLRLDPRTAEVPILMLSAKGEEADKVVGFSVGADDYVTKPFSVRELILRVKAAVRRGPSRPAAPPGPEGTLELDFRQRKAWVDDEEVPLSEPEFALLARLAGAMGTPVPRAELARAAGELDVDIEGLRAKLGPAGARLQAREGAFVLGQPTS